MERSKSSRVPKTRFKCTKLTLKIKYRIYSKLSINNNQPLMTQLKSQRSPRRLLKISKDKNWLKNYKLNKSKNLRE